MKIRELIDFLFEYRKKHGTDPAFIPVTISEISEVVSHPEYVVVMSSRLPDSICGVAAYETELGPEMRQQQIRVPLIHISESLEVDPENLRLHLVEGKRQMLGTMWSSLRAQILSSQSKITVEFEWDPLAKLKRILHITRWFPVKKKSAVIDCRILYPYAINPLPHNRHSVSFRISQ